MKKEDLVASAEKLPPFPATAAAEFGEKRQALVSQVNSLMASRADIETLVGPENMEMMKNNHANHGLFIESMLETFDPNVLVETILWVFTAYKSRNFHDNYWVAQLNSWITAIESSLSNESAESVMKLYHWMVIHIPQFSAITGESQA